MVTVKELIEYLDSEYYFRMHRHQWETELTYDSDRLYLLRQCMTLIAMSMIERGEY